MCSASPSPPTPDSSDTTPASPPPTLHPDTQTDSQSARHTDTQTERETQIDSSVSGTNSTLYIVLGSHLYKLLPVVVINKNRLVLRMSAPVRKLWHVNIDILKMHTNMLSLIPTNCLINETSELWQTCSIFYVLHSRSKVCSRVPQRAGPSPEQVMSQISSSPLPDHWLESDLFGWDTSSRLCFAHCGTRLVTLFYVLLFPLPLSRSHWFAASLISMKTEVTENSLTWSTDQSYRFFLFAYLQT